MQEKTKNLMRNNSNRQIKKEHLDKEREMKREIMILKAVNRKLLKENDELQGRIKWFEDMWDMQE